MSKAGEWVSSLSATRSTIDLASKQLASLRQCRELDDLYKNEIIESENNLINMFGKLILTQSKLNQDNKYGLTNNNDSNNNNHMNNNSEFSDIEYWLKVVGVNKKLVRSLSKKMTLLEMVGMGSDELKEHVMKENGEVSSEDVKVLLTAVQNLKKEMKLLDSNNNSKQDLSWSTFKNCTSSYHDSHYTSNSPKPPRHHSHQFHQQRPSTSSLPTETTTLKKRTNTPPHLSNMLIINTNYLTPNSTHNYSRSTLPAMTPPPTPLSKNLKKFPTTPPLSRKIKLNFDPLTKSKSHESQLFSKISQDGLDLKKRFFKKKPSNANLVSSSDALITSPCRLNTPHPDHNNHSISDDGLNSQTVTQLQVPPTSPDPTLRSSHKFGSRLVWGSCDLCHRQLIFISRVCKYCKLKFHHDCAPKYLMLCEGSPGPNSKQLHRRLLLQKHGVVKQQINQPLNQQQQRLLNNQQQQLLNNQQQQSMLGQQGQQLLESSSASSCSSSTPSSPSTTTSSNFPHQHLYNSENTRFKYPEPSESSMEQSFESSHPSNPDVLATTDSDKSDKTITGSGCSSGDHTTSSSNIEHTDSVDSNDEQHFLNRDHSVSLKELSIPYDELKILKRIGEGRFGTVFKGWWHGDVAIKQLNTYDAGDDESLQLRRQAFKVEVANLKKTRHETLVLFMGACIEPQRLAIITSYIDGSSISDMLHGYKKRFTLNQAIIIASQVAQGLGYLHAKGIVHRHLRSNNVFLSKNKKDIFKVLITDYGLSLHQLCKSSREGYWLSIPSGWLSYQSPEIIKTLRPTRTQPDLPCSKQSDIYAFGTIWYELLTSRRPYQKLSCEEVIWLVGTGCGRPKLNTLPEYMDVLSSCWSYDASKRPSCEWLLRRMETLPRKRLSRSPSHPLQITRSVKPIF